MNSFLVILHTWERWAFCTYRWYVIQHVNSPPPQNAHRYEAPSNKIPDVVRAWEPPLGRPAYGRSIRWVESSFHVKDDCQVSRWLDVYKCTINNGQKMHLKCIFSKINPGNCLSACLPTVLTDHLICPIILIFDTAPWRDPGWYRSLIRFLNAAPGWALDNSDIWYRSLT